MEFGIFIQACAQKSLPGRPQAEHHALMEEMDYVVQADRAGFKYAWVTEHHFLEEYSHLSANDVVIGYLTHATERIHLGSGIFNPLAKVNHRQGRRAGRHARPLSGGRFEFGSAVARAATRSSASCRADRHERHQGDLGGDHRGVPQDVAPGRVPGLPGQALVAAAPQGPAQAVRQGHPAMWYAAGSPGSYEMAAARASGLGFSVQKVSDMEWVVNSYKNAVRDAEPVGAFVNDNVMVTSTAICAETTRRPAASPSPAAQLPPVAALPLPRHLPRPEGIPVWPELLPEYSEELIDLLIQEELMICGDPDEVLRQCKRWESAGADQLVFGLPIGIPPQATADTIRLIGEHVIPKIDTDPVHRTTRFRRTAG
ncbi:LLM class flavin-dependent oxidoreductase [Streptacidiphilus sp. 4-A2]|nr:LLM class flavin-dependent oxidoreductase [Streptacidiphilus sp. 4-A2]